MGKCPVDSANEMFMQYIDKGVHNILIQTVAGSDLRECWMVALGIEEWPLQWAQVVQIFPCGQRLVYPASPICFLSGVPDFFDRNKILSGGDLSHYQVPHCIRVFFYFVWFVFIHHNFQFYFELCTYCNILDIYLS